MERNSNDEDAEAPGPLLNESTETSPDDFMRQHGNYFPINPTNLQTVQRPVIAESNFWAIF